ncbi:hypothetical protein KVA01_22800 [Kocuria varians]|uniref:Cell division protein CrgA n=1 Tax=Kocuria varians TaxID=1272 RepID=A0A4Y4D4L0_KOCVA|nr:cell division protein CrgA [Kocuria varians]GED00126.1 hypothetical protein KVA01_22800 [Kocuria varians]
MAQSQKRFRRSRTEDDDLQQFTLTERDRELTALAAEILPRTSAAASFERHAARNAGSTSVTARDAVTDRGTADDDASRPSRGGASADAAGESNAPAAADTTDSEVTADGAGAKDARGAAHHGTKKRKGRNKGARGTAVGAASSSKSTASATKAKAPSATGTTTAAAETAEETPAELKARRKRELAAQRREAKAAKAAEREQRAGDYQPTPTWYKVIMVGLMIVALLWIISYYLFQGLIPIPGIGVWNLVIGLAFMLTGLIMTTRWR